MSNLVSLHVEAKKMLKYLTTTKVICGYLRMVVKQKATFKNHTFCELYQDLLGTPRQKPTSGFIN